VPIAGALRATERSDGELVAQLRNKLQMSLAVCGGRWHEGTHLWLMVTN
jgi:hypothetical protein